MNRRGIAESGHRPDKNGNLGAPSSVRPIAAPIDDASRSRAAPSMLDDLHDQIKSWPFQKPDLTAVDILARLKALQPDRVTDKQARTVSGAR